MDVTADVELKNNLKRQKEAFEYQSNHDALTQLPNRVLFLDRLKQGVYTSQRNKKELAVLFIDLDNFKEINDSLGHDVGDKVLIEISNRMKSRIRDSDTIARLGGDEFCIILHGISSINDVAKVIEEGMKVVETPIVVNEHQLHIGMSIGVSMYPRDGSNEIELLKNADAAMYKAKRSGRNTYCFYNESLTDDAAAYLSLEADMRKGLEQDEFLPYFQPQVDIKTQKLLGMELLMRWEHPKLGLLAPFKFIPMAEKTGFILDLDRYLMQKAIEIVADWKSQNLHTGILAINIVPKNLESDDFHDILITLLKENSLKRKDIELEVTESSIMKDPKKAIEKLNELTSSGINIAIDDFGTGYSSLSYLKKFPIQKLKIDRSFIIDLLENEEDKGIVKMLIGLCDILKLDVIAEGVETYEQGAYLLEHGCRKAQGYFYSKPLSRDEMFKYLKASC